MMLTLAALTTQFLERPGLAVKTVRSYEFTLLPLLSEYGSTPIEILTRPTLEAYLNDLTHLAYTTHQQHQAILQALLNFAVEQGYLKANPIARLKHRKPNPNKSEHGSDASIRYLTPEQLQLLYQVVQTDVRMTALVSLLHRTGARISELLAVDLEQVDLRPRKFQVVGKGNKQRWCFYSPDTAEALAKYLKYYRHASSPALFTAQQPKSGKVGRLSYDTAYRCWKSLIELQPQIVGARLHDLRHTFATERVGLMGIEELRALMGHENIQTTLRYQKVTSQRAEMVAHQALGALIQSGN